MHPEQQRVKQLLTEAITLLCRNNLQFREDVTVEGLLGITLDKSDVFLVSIHETIQCVLKGGAVEVRAEKRNVSNHEDGHTPRKRCRRRQGSREGSSSPPLYHSNQIDPKPDTSTKISECINVKLEETDDDHQFGQPSEECVKLSLVHDSTHKLPSDDNATIEKQQDLPGGYVEDACDAGEVQVKQEVQEQEVEEEKRPVVYIDRHDVTDTSHSLPPHGIYVGLYDWASPGDDQSGFSLSELDTISTANSKQQVHKDDMMDIFSQSENNWSQLLRAPSPQVSTPQAAPKVARPPQNVPRESGMSRISHSLPRTCPSSISGTPEQHKALLGGFLHRFDKIDEKQDEILGMLCSLCERGATSSVEEIFDTPCSSIIELNRLEEKLTDKTRKWKMVEYLSTLRGYNPSETVRRILSTLGSNALWSHFSFCGRRNSEKQAFAELKLCRVVKQACTRSHPELQDAEIERLIKDCLKYAPFKKGGPKHKLEPVTQKTGALDEDKPEIPLRAFVSTGQQHVIDSAPAAMDKRDFALQEEGFH